MTTILTNTTTATCGRRTRGSRSGPGQDTSLSGQFRLTQEEPSKLSTDVFPSFNSCTPQTSPASDSMSPSHVLRLASLILPARTHPHSHSSLSPSPLCL
ncbi:hypothetical protein BD309DRAFT_146671 [Dichomitus squalens]|nr:hypothetical protein BD309DRAFT_146671 [Dichomitus squalens]